MISYIKKEPNFKKSIIIGSITMIILYIGFTMFNYIQFSNIHQNQVRRFQGVIATVVEKYPEMEAEVVRSILHGNLDKEGLGDEILRKYGYDLNIGLANDPSFMEYRADYIKSNIMLLTVLVILNIGVIFVGTRYFFKYLEKISSVLDKFIDGDYNSAGNGTEEGIISIISSQLNQLGKNISVKYTKLENEKESTKALVTDISHQLKTPLASLGMCNDILEDDSLSKEERVEFLNMSNENIKKLHSLIDSLVNISRLEVAMIKLKPRYSDIKETIFKAYNSAAVKANSKSISMNLNISDEIIKVKHDSKWTEEAIFNLIDNGIKYTPEGGEIDLEFEETLNYVKIHIKDNGIGIDKKEFNGIFKRFYRVKGEDNSIEGTGIGLYLTRKIMEEQGGSVIVKSKLGEGSTFTVMLPK